MNTCMKTNDNTVRSTYLDTLIEQYETTISNYENGDEELLCSGSHIDILKGKLINLKARREVLTNLEPDEELEEMDFSTAWGVTKFFSSLNESNRLKLNGARKRMNKAITSINKRIAVLEGKIKNGTNLVNKHGKDDDSTIESSFENRVDTFKKQLAFLKQEKQRKINDFTEYERKQHKLRVAKVDAPAKDDEKETITESTDYFEAISSLFEDTVFTTNENSTAGIAAVAFPAQTIGREIKFSPSTKFLTPEEESTVKKMFARYFAKNIDAKILTEVSQNKQRRIDALVSEKSKAIERKTEQVEELTTKMENFKTSGELNAALKAKKEIAYLNQEIAGLKADIEKTNKSRAKKLNKEYVVRTKK